MQAAQHFIVSQTVEVKRKNLIPPIYEHLRRQAWRYMAGERSGHMLQPTALVNEVHLRLVDCKLVHMDTELWRRIEDLFHRGLELDESLRGRFLPKECGNNHELRREVESLLALDLQAADFLERPTSGQVPGPSGDQAGSTQSVQGASDNGTPGETIIGPYRRKSLFVTG